MKVNKTVSFCFLFILFVIFICTSVCGAAAEQASPNDFPICKDSGGDCIGGSPSIVYDGENFFVVWVKASNIYGARVCKDGTVLDKGDGIAISVGDNENGSFRQPSVGFDGTNFFVVWAATRGGSTEVYGCRVTKNGEVLDPDGIKLTDGGDVYIKPVAIAFDGANYFLVWRTSTSVVRGMRFAPDGTAVDDKSGFKISDNGYYPSITYDSADCRYLVAWHTGAYGSLTVWGTIIDIDGNFVTPDNFLICDDPQDKENARSAFDGTNFMVIWYDWRPDSDQIKGTCYGTRVTPDGVVLDKPAFPIADRVRGQIFPNIVFDGENYVAVWSTDSQANNKFRLNDVYSTRINKSGQVLDRQPIPVSTAFETQFGPSIAYGDGKYLVAWNDYRDERMGSTPRLYGRIFDKGIDNKQVSYEEHTLPDADWTTYTESNIGQMYYGMAFSDNYAYLFGDYHYIKYENGAWSSPLDESFPQTYAGCALSKDHFYVGGWAGLPMYYNGNDWIGFCDGLNLSSLITGMWGTGSDNLWASLSYENTFYHYDGKKWSMLPPVADRNIEDMTGINSSNIYAVGEKGLILHYNGTTWSVMPDVPTIQTLNALCAFDARNVFAVGDAGTILYYDGSKWEAQTTCTNHDLKDIWGFNKSDIYAVGFNGTILHYDGSKWNLENSGSSEDLLTVFGGYNKVNSTGTVWAAGGTTIFQKDKPVEQLTVYPPDGFQYTLDDNNRVNLSWTLPDNTAITGYTVEYGVKDSSVWSSVSVGRVGSYIISGMDDSKTYNIRIKAIYQYNFESEYSTITASTQGKKTVTFDSRGGSPVDSKMIDYNALIPVPDDPVREGYTFDGWYKDSACTSVWNFSQDTVNTDITLYAKWTTLHYTVSFMDWNGTIIANQVVDHGTKATAPSAPNRTGYTFGGWYKDSGLTSIWDFSADTVKGDTILYSRWNINSYTVHFNSQGGSSLADITVPFGSRITAPPTPVRATFDFTGWFKDSGCTMTWNFSTDTVNDITILYAGWVAQPRVPTLNGLGLSAGQLTRSFSPKLTSYTVQLGETEGNVTVTPDLTYDGAIMTIDGKKVAAKAVKVGNGKSVKMTVKITLGKKSVSYRLTIRRAKSTINTLAALTASTGTWSRAFDPSLTAYTLTLPVNVAKVSLYATRTTGLSSVSPVRRSITVRPGKPVKVTFKVKAQSGAARTYTVLVVR